MRSRRTDSRRGVIKVAAPHRPTAPRTTTPVPPAPGFLIGAALVGIALLVIGTVRSGAPANEPTSRPTIAEATDDDFADILGTTTTPAAQPPTEAALGAPAEVDEAAVLIVEQRRAEMIERASDFMVAIGAGRGDEAARMVDSRVATPLGNLVGFYAEFRSGLRTANCFSLALNAVSCDAYTTDPALGLIGVGSTRQRVIVAFGTDGGVQSFGIPTAFGSATTRLSRFAHDLDSEAYRLACDAASYPTASIVPMTLGYAATPECGSVLAGVAGAYLSQ